MSLSILERQLVLPSPIERIFEHKYADYQIFMKRDDLIHPSISGNKWRKLKYNLSHFYDSNIKGITTVGGPFSNHLVALATSCFYLNVPCTGFVRGTRIDPKNPTLNWCQKMGMNLIPMYPDDYAKRQNSEILDEYCDHHNHFYLPEGGSNEYAVKGCRELLDEIHFSPDYVILPIGTGGTAAGLVKELKNSTLIGISPFKEGKVNIPWADIIDSPHEINYDYCMNGYGRYHHKLVDYINSFWEQYKIPLDPIYNAKGMMALESFIHAGKLTKGSTIVYLHTGGLQGISGFNYIHGQKTKIMIPNNIYFPGVDQ